MESQLRVEPPDIAYLIRSIPSTEITSTLQLLQLKASQDLHDKILNINNSISSINNAKSQMSDYDLMYLYHTLRSLSDVFHNLEDEVFRELKNIRNEYICNVCMKRVRIYSRMSLLGNLNSHICSPLMRLDLGGNNTSSIFQLQEYNLCQTIHYDSDIKQQLFFEITCGDERVHFYTIYIFEEVFMCLVCECNIFGRNNVIQHVSGQKHARALNELYEILIIFHGSFAKLDSKYQLFQREFTLIDIEKTKCMNCTKNILFKDLLNHLKGSKCFKSISENTQIKLVNYADLIKKTIYRDLLDWYIVIGNKQYPILQNIENRIYCLVCNTNLTRNIPAHTNARPHIENSSAKNIVDTIKKYHTIWTAQPVSVQIEQVYFRRRETKITCTLCSMSLPYDRNKLLTHVESANHKKFMMRYKNNGNVSESGTSRSTSVEAHASVNKHSSESVSSRSTSVEAERHISPITSTPNTASKTVIRTATNNDKTSSEQNSPVHNNILAKIKMVPYDKSIFDELYSDGLLHFTASIGCIKYPVIIKRGIYKYCFICNIDIATSTLLHANSVEHQESLNSEHRRGLLKKFHDLWLDMPSTDQCRQVLFNVDDKLTCVLCKNGLEYDTKELKSHLDAWEHVQKVMSTYYNNVSLIDKQDKTNIRENIATDTLIDLTENDSQAKSSDENIKDKKMIDALAKLYKEDIVFAKGIIKKDLLNYFEEKSTAEKEDSFINETVSETRANKIEDTPTKLGAITYSKEILNEIYPEELIHYHVRINNIKYPCIQNMGSYKRCLICNIDLIGSVLFHINSTPHVATSSDSKRMDQLKRYHDLWLSFSASDQREQKYFEIGEKLTCAACQKELDYDIDNLNSHIFSFGHTNKVWSLNNPSAITLELTPNDEIAKENIEVAEEQNLLDLSDDENQQEIILDLDTSSIPDLSFQNDKEELELMNSNSAPKDEEIIQHKIINSEQNFLKDLNQEVTTDSSPTSTKSIPRYLSEIHKRAMKLPIWTQNDLFSEETNCVKYYIYANMPSDYIESESGTSNSTPSSKSIIKASNKIKKIHNLQAQNVKVKPKNKLEAFKGESLDILNWTDNDYFLQETNCVKYYLYSTIATDEITKRSSASNTKSYTSGLGSNAGNQKNMSSDYDYHKNFVAATASLPLLLIRNNIYYCVDCKDICRDNINNHTSSRKHIRKRRKKDSYINQYILQLSKFNLPHKNEPNDFIPSTSSLTFCLKCGIHVLYRKLKDHLDRFHQDIEYSLKSKLSDDFPTIPGPYNKRILHTIFKHSPPECAVIFTSTSYPVLQISSQRVHCLICKTKVIQEDPLEHLASARHIRLFCVVKIRRQVKKYHSGWSKLGPRYWDQLQFFDNEDNSFHCLVCKDKLSKKKFKDHWENERHSLVEPNLIEYGSSEALMNSNKYSASLRDTSILPGKDGLYMCMMYPKKINETVRKTNCVDLDIIQRSPNNKFTCLVCHVEIDDVIKHTTKDLPHQAKLLDWSTNIEPIRYYHLSWSCMDADFEELQNLFYPITSTVVFCTVCCLNLNYSYLRFHLGQCHVGNEVALQEKLNPAFIFASKKEYCEKVRKILYKNNVSQCNIILESISYPVIQTLHNTIRCLLCYKEILDSKFNHLSSGEHVMNALNAHMRRRLKNYHDTWLDGDEDFQMQQMYFERDGPLIYCKLCLLDANVLDLREHIRTDLHKASLNKFLIRERVSGKSNVFQDIEIMPQLTNEKSKLDSAYSEEYYSLDSESEDNEACSKHYDETVSKELYPDMNAHYLIILGNAQYPLFRKTVVGVKCMICKRNPNVISIDQHLMLESHRYKVVDRTAQNKLIRFHDTWRKQEASVQMHQKYFHRMKCIPCDMQVGYEMIKKHVLSSEHGKNIALPFSKSENEEYSDSSLKSAPVPSTISSDSNAYISFRNINSNSRESPIKEVIKNKAKTDSSSKAGSSKKSQHDIRKAVLNPNSPKILDKIPLRYAAHKRFLVMDKNENIFCECCFKKLMHDIPSIKNHLDSANHISCSRINRKKMKFYCEICLKHYSAESSWGNHLVDLTHIARFNNLDKNGKENVTEYECLTCQLVIFGDEITVRRHISGLTKKKTKEITLPKKVVSLLANRNFIAQSAEKLLMEANDASQSQDKEKQVCTALVKVVKEIYPMCKAYPFGSRVTGLGYCDSDLDVFLDIGDMYHGNQNQDPADQTNIVNRIAKLLQKHKNSFGDINKVAAARTPIVQVFHKESNIDCDVSFRHGLSVENTAFISLCLDLQPILRPTMLYLKEWYAATNLSGLSSYALTILMVFYLQTNQFLLSIKQLRDINPEPSNVIDGWETIKYSVSLQRMKQAVIVCDYTVIELMENFFEYYTKFDFEKWVICPLMGNLLVTKSHFNGNGTDLPPEMSRYVMKLYCLNPEFFRNLTPMCVQDPFDLSHNLTKACTKDMLKKFQAYCDLSKKHISALN